MTKRSSKFTPKLIETICRRIAEGESVRSICRGDDMPSKSSVMSRLNDDEDFRSHYILARDLQADHFAEEIIEIADDATNDFMERERQDGSAEAVAEMVLTRRHRSGNGYVGVGWVSDKREPRRSGDSSLVSDRLNTVVGTMSG